MKISEVILPFDMHAIAPPPVSMVEPQFAIVPITPEVSRPQIDPVLQSLLKSKRLELDNKHMAVRLKRCRKGHPPNPKWEQTWANYKASVLQKLVAEYQPPLGTAVLRSLPQLDIQQVS